MKTPFGLEIVSLFEQLYPKHLAMEGDKIGLQIGTLNKEVSQVLVALDVTLEVVEEAIAKQANLIIAHHPLIYRPLKTIETDTTYGKIVATCIQHNIAIYIAHSNLDIAPGGVNDLLADALQLQETKPLVPTYEKPSENKGELSGLGRIGKLAKEMTLQEFAEHVKEKLEVKAVRVVRNKAGKPVSRVAVLGGSGGNYWYAAKSAGADVYVTGDLDYHTAHDAQMAGLNLIDPGHNVEKIMKKGVQEKLQWMLKEKEFKVDIISSEIKTEPFIIF